MSLPLVPFYHLRYTLCFPLSWVVRGWSGPHRAEGGGILCHITQRGGVSKVTQIPLRSLTS